MGMTNTALKKKIADAKPSSWLSDGLTKEEIEQALREGEIRSKIMQYNIRVEDINAIKTATKIIATICDKHTQCTHCPFEREDKDGFFDCILDTPPSEWDGEEITKCFT